MLRYATLGMFCVMARADKIPTQEEKQRKLLRVRLEMAKFLQETMRESGLQANAHIIGSDAFKEFFRKVTSCWAVSTRLES